ncbi:putative inner membrane protein [Rubripirellula obstinata]|uniref:Putative inner membrane protein n=1 Tax=Rubripirellula obstinata TaxID=406547 RepID=A0A5B1CMI8_9BACT|nr:AI-2E family transporter [Rubripirellula obstinata]KAA1261562.1 putative inner membrane protein [Rubripirellula obstinata]
MSKRNKKTKSTAPTGSDAPSADQPAANAADAGPLDNSLASGSQASMSALPPLSRILSVVMLILGILIVGVLFLQVMAGFFVPLFLAALLVVIFRPVHQWIYRKSGQRPKVAATATTSLVLLMVLMPVIAVISVATSQFTSIVTYVDFDDFTGAFDRARAQLGIALEHPQQFRRLDELTDSLDETRDPETGITTEDDAETILIKIEEAKELIAYLHEEVSGPPTADPDAENAQQSLSEYAETVQAHLDQKDVDLITQVNTDELFDQKSVNASASIRTWMRSKLGGTFRSQVCLLANPSAEDFRDLLRKGREFLQPRFVSLTSATGNYLGKFLIGLVVLVVAVYFFLIDGSSMIHTLMRLSPLDDAYEERLLIEFERTSRAVVLASFVSAFAQGILATIAFWLCGFDSLILLFLITSLMALVPFLGAASVWLPCAIYLGAVDQRWYVAIALAVYGAGIISTVDNFIKPMVLQGRTTLHPLFALLSVLGGLAVFGPVGIVVGPMVVVFLQTLLEILSHELAERDAGAGAGGEAN